MAIELVVPSVGESITEVQIAQWLKAVGDEVKQDEGVVELETDKATVELPAPAAGTLSKLLKSPGEQATVGEVIGYMEEGAAAKTDGKKPSRSAGTTHADKPATISQPEFQPAEGSAGTTHADKPATTSQPEFQPPSKPDQPTRVMPAAERALAERGLTAGQVEATGPGGRLLKEDVEQAPVSKVPEGADEEIVPMSPLRRRIAERLVSAQHNAALLTTFNEVDMSQVMALRQQYKDSFEKRYGIRLGIMSFFVKAAIDALKLIPQLNAEIRGTDIVYKNHYDIGVAVSSRKGLVVPVIRNGDRLSFAELEKVIEDFGKRAKENKIELEDLEGGTFTISNGGVFGSLMSTPIVNPPQSGVLGMHAMQERPVARDGQVVIRPMMYVALTYDHRVVDGREAVTFLKRIKEGVENPARLLLEV